MQPWRHLGDLHPGCVMISRTPSMQEPMPSLICFTWFILSCCGLQASARWRSVCARQPVAPQVPCAICASEKILPSTCSIWYGTCCLAAPDPAGGACLVAFPQQAASGDSHCSSQHAAKAVLRCMPCCDEHGSKPRLDVPRKMPAASCAGPIQLDTTSRRDAELCCVLRSTCFMRIMTQLMILAPGPAVIC